MRLRTMRILSISVVPRSVDRMRRNDGNAADAVHGNASSTGHGGRTKAVENARVSFQAAKAAGCEIAAPFEYYMAQEYLQLAERELAEGDKNHVAGFAEKSKAHSTKAMEMAKGGIK